MAKGWPPLPAIPILTQIDNVDQDNHYQVSWSVPGYSKLFTLEESTTSDFVAPNIVYQGGELAWQVPAEGKLPGTYYYRVKNSDDKHESDWSIPQVITINPLFVGMHNCWDSVGYLRGDWYYDIG